MMWSWSNPAEMLRENWITGISPDTKAPYDEQIVVGLDHELFKNFKVSLNYMYKVKKNILDDALYDLETGQTWYNPTTTPGNEYWVPFTTTVPAAWQFPCSGSDHVLYEIMMLLKTGFSRSETFLRVSANILLLNCPLRNVFPMAGSWVVRLTILRPGAICRVVTLIFTAIPPPPMMLTGLFMAMAGPMTIARWLSSSSVRLTFPMDLWLPLITASAVALPGLGG